MSVSTVTPLLVLISAASGAGKTTLCQELLAADARLRRAVTCTTRPPRPGEAPGVDYHFLEPADFRRRLAAGEFLEHATVHGHLYGTLKAEVMDRLRAAGDVLLNIDVQGAASIRAVAERDEELRRALVTVFLVPPSYAELERRLRKRAQDSEEVIQRRLAAAAAEMAHWREFDYVIVADTVPEGLRRLQCVVEAERLRQPRIKVTLALEADGRQNSPAQL
jgi:guanylate kinase